MSRLHFEFDTMVEHAPATFSLETDNLWYAVLFLDTLTLLIERHIPLAASARFVHNALEGFKSHSTKGCCSSLLKAALTT